MEKLNAVPFILGTLVLGLFSSCKSSVDYLVYNAKIYTASQSFAVEEAMAIKEGKIVELGESKVLEKKYQAKESYNAMGKTILPGLFDGHAHFYGYGQMLQNADLKEIDSWDKTLEALVQFAGTHKEGWLLGRGWDQNLWPDKKYPTKEKLDELFPDRPVYLKRIDGHAAVVNQKALDLAKFSESTQVEGGELIKENGKLTGVLIDKAKDELASFIPQPSEKQSKEMLLEAQKYSLSQGLTTIVDAGLDYPLLELIERLQKEGSLKMGLQVMLSDSDENLAFLQKRGVIKTDRLLVNGFKFYSDGALGSRGACLLHDYHDRPGHRGLLLSGKEHFLQRAKVLYDEGFQMNTHAIGDSANRVILEVYSDVLGGKNDRRWRMEHAQIVDPVDFKKFGDYSIVPSVQPTHATSDMLWAIDRLGAERLKNAYAYKRLLDQNGYLVLGTDFPVEDISPMKTFYAATARKNTAGIPEGGFQKENALSRKEALWGMTLWAAKGSFLEKEKGSLEKGKWADFIVLDRDLLEVPEEQILSTKVLKTYIHGELLMDYESFKSSLRAGK